MTDLLTPLKRGGIARQNRRVMARMTRGRAEPSGEPRPLAAT